MSRGVDASMPSPPKCSLLGSYEQVGPTDADAANDFWDNLQERLSVGGVRIRAGERLSSIALCKRLAAPTTLASEFGLGVDDLRFPDATIAASLWLQDAGIDPDHIRREHGEWNGRWIHQSRRVNQDDDDAPPPEGLWTLISEQDAPLRRLRTTPS